MTFFCNWVIFLFFSFKQTKKGLIRRRKDDAMSPKAEKSDLNVPIQSPNDDDASSRLTWSVFPGIGGRGGGGNTKDVAARAATAPSFHQAMWSSARLAATVETT